LSIPFLRILVNTNCITPLKDLHHHDRGLFFPSGQR
jgi:hypothetical protein